MTNELIEAGLRQHQAGRLDEAQRCYEQALARAPRHADALHLLGVIALQRGDAARALVLIGQALEGRPDDPRFHANCAQACLALERVADARAAFERARALDPREPGFALGAAACLAREGRLPQAEAQLRRLVAEHPGFARAWHNLGNAVREQGRAEEALEIFRRATGLEPDFPDSHAGLGNALHALQRFDEAEQSYRRFLALRPDAPDGWCNLASVLIDRGRFPEALAACEQGLARARDAADLHWLRGVALAALGRSVAALGAFRAAFTLAPENTRLMRAYGSALHGTGHAREGRYWLERALALEPSHELRHLLSVSCLKDGDLQAGWAAYEARPARQEFLSRQSGPAPVRELPASLSGSRICVLREQGLGDEIFFLRFARALVARGASVTYRAGARLASILERVPVLDRVIAQNDAVPAADFVVMAGDLPHALSAFPSSALQGREAALPAAKPPRLLRVFFPEIPPALPLAPLPGEVERMRHELARLGAPPYLGITWRAGTPPEAQRGTTWSLHKEVALPDLGGALRGARGTVIALQRGPAPGEIEQLAARLGRTVHDLTALNEDLEAMLALLALLDEYIGVSNTNMHLRAGTGRGARVLVPQPPEWRWMSVGDASPWFPGFRVYRQGIDGDWSEALGKLARDLLL